MSELKTCPFCGSAARSDNGFIPIEGVEYVWCTNQTCKLSDFDIDFTPEIWNRRAPDRELIRYALHQSGWPMKLPRREDFEAWCRDTIGWNPVYMPSINDQGYSNRAHDIAWRAYQAAIASIPQPPFTDLDAAVETIASGWEGKKS